MGPRLATSRPDRVNGAPKIECQFVGGAPVLWKHESGWNVCA